MSGATSPQAKDGVFLSHTARDKAFACRLATDLLAAGARVWVDEAELGVGDSLIARISEGIDEMQYLAVVLSPASVESEWVRRELEIAINHEIRGRSLKVLPLLLEPCTVPAFLLGKKYADFSDPDRYSIALSELLARLGLAGDVSAVKYDAYPFADGPRRFKNLPERAFSLLRNAAGREGQLIEVDWSEVHFPRRLRSIRIGSHQVDIGDPEQGDEWYTAFQALEARWLIQAVGSRPGYTAYKVTPDGWDLVKFGADSRRDWQGWRPR